MTSPVQKEGLPLHGMFMKILNVDIVLVGWEGVLMRIDQILSAWKFIR